MEEMESKLLEAVKELTEKAAAVDLIQEKLGKIDDKLEQQTDRLDRMQIKVEMSMASLGHVHQEQAMTGSVDDYKSAFDQLLYHIRLYDHTEISESWLVSHFVLGLQEAIRVHVQALVPAIVIAAYHLAVAKESAMEEVADGKKK
uniref:Uncharacterized protein n=1 Tax=Leersia perrieri TaxID=77586 RepID=A0A0D9VEA8_9ORYZ